MLQTIDWIIVIFFLLLTILISIYFSKRAGKNLTEFFLSGRSLPWYIAGISMVATTFAADTPLAITELIHKNGISGNWIWWNMLIGGMLTTFFFASKWRKANILTEVEFIELRYGQEKAAFLRGFKAVYLGIFMNILIMGWVNIAFISILQVFFNIPETQVYYYVFGTMLFIALYSSLSGLWGVAVNDIIQFVIAMTGTIVLAILVLNSEKVGGIDGLKSKLDPSVFEFFPNISNIKDASHTFTIGIGTFLAFIGFQWWASWYPGNEPGGGGYIAQRMMSTKNEKHATGASLLFQIAHYCIRPWPWIIVALATLVLYPELDAENAKLGYVMAMRDYLPAGWKGLLLVAFIAAYMSTISTQLNWGSSYIVNDLYLRFSKKKKNDRESVRISRLTTLLLCILSIFVTTQFSTIEGIWHFILECGAGLGLVLILRWYWWRINAWSEITATIIPIIFYALLKFVFKLEFPDSFFWTIGLTTISWIIVTFTTKAEDTDTLNRFHDRIKPEGNWSVINKTNYRGLGKTFINWISAVTLTYSVLFATGKLIFKEWQDFLIYSLVFLISLIVFLFSWQIKPGKEKNLN